MTSLVSALRAATTKKWGMRVFVSAVAVAMMVGLGPLNVGQAGPLQSSSGQLQISSSRDSSISSNQQHRELYPLSTRQCTLNTDIVKFRYDEYTGLYVPIVERHYERDLQAGISQSDGAIEKAKSCWCASAFFDRPVEYCPARFDTCIVQGTTGPIQCYNASSGDSLVRSFWPVLVFWFVVLCYGLSCSEPGGSSREYVSRHFRVNICCCCFPNTETDQAILDRDLANLLQRQPERAAFLYRSAVLRARQYRFRRDHHQRRWWNCWGRRNSDTNNRSERDGEIYALYLQARYDTLTLKTRVFSDCENGQQAAAHESASSLEPAAAFEVSSSSLNSHSRSNNNDETTRTAAGWLPPQFRREQVTLDEMDDEMEHGVRCAICLTRLVQGDVVGDIPCGHVFHKDCLKDWLKRSNRCPLCQQQDIARLSPCTREDLSRLEQVLPLDSTLASGV